MKQKAQIGDQICDDVRENDINSLLKGGRQEALREGAGATKSKDACGQHGALMGALTLMV